MDFHSTIFQGPNQKAGHIHFLVSMNSLKSITIYTQIHQFCENQPQRLLRFTTFHEKSPEKCQTCSKVPIISPLPGTMLCQVCKKPCHATVARNDQTNSQTTLNKGAGGATLTIFVTDCRILNYVLTTRYRIVTKHCPLPLVKFTC